MRLFRAKKLFANCGGFIYEGQLFLAESPAKLPTPPNRTIDECGAEFYDELVSPNSLFPLQKLIKLKSL